MNVTFACPHCEQPARVDFDDRTTSLVCPHCQTRLELPAGEVVGQRVVRCLVCPSTDLFVRKDFPQRLGVAIVVTGFAISCITWYQYQVLLTFGVLFATAAIDLALYFLVGNALACYRCGAQYRGTAELDTHGGFDLETHERHRQLSARLGKPARQPQRMSTPSAAEQ